MDRLKNVISRAYRKNNKLALMFLDLDGFKDINDTLGHAAGDQLLIAVAERINGVIKEKDTLCRLGGDEYTLILEDLNDATEAEKVAQEILLALEEPFIIFDSEVHIMISIGITVGPADHDTEESLISKADIAMYQAKESNFSHYCFISEDIERKIKAQHKISMDMRTALKAEEFFLHLQPQIRIINEKIELSGAEALLRWTNKNGTAISPKDFISVAESNGMIHDIGLWVFEEVFRINEILRSQGIVINLSLNVSVIQFERNDFIKSVADIVKANKVPIDLTIEITESLFFKDLKKGIVNLTTLKSLGFKIALDDFGTGFSSMSYLNRLPLDSLKIAKSFIDEVSFANKKNLAYSILSMAAMLDLKTVAEGIETKEQEECILEAGCDILQGCLYSKPLALESFINYAKNIK